MKELIDEFAPERVEAVLAAFCEERDRYLVCSHGSGNQPIWVCLGKELESGRRLFEGSDDECDRWIDEKAMRAALRADAAWQAEQRPKTVQPHPIERSPRNHW